MVTTHGLESSSIMVKRQPGRFIHYERRIEIGLLADQAETQCGLGMDPPAELCR